jgi:two-component system, chemotaxis family, chemotaxis protein CheY
MLPSKIDLSEIGFLLVEDNRFMRQLLTEMLRSFGSTDIREARSGEEALEQIDARLPDIIFCDWMMSSMDGLSFIRELRTDNQSVRSRIPVIMITGHATADKFALALGEGADSFIVKPFKAATLLTHIVKIITGQQVQLVD